MNKIHPIRLHPKLDSRLWGGQRLARWLGLPEPLPTHLAEAWLIYAQNRIQNGEFAQRTLAQAARALGQTLLGTESHARYGLDFPQLTKFIDANARFSIQVHPDDTYAHSVEAHTHFHGKTEAWYILHAQPDANIIYGLQRPSSRHEFQQAVQKGELETLINILPVKTGDVIYVPAGTLHAINQGILLFEVQQSSDLTYRVYDYQRRGPDGQMRPLHLQKALDVMAFHPPAQEQIPPLALGPGRDLLIASPHFALERHHYVEIKQLSTRPTSFETWTVIQGTAQIAGETLRTGQALLLPAQLGPFAIEPQGQTTLLRTLYPNIQQDYLIPLQRLGYSAHRIAQTVKQQTTSKPATNAREHP